MEKCEREEKVDKYCDECDRPMPHPDIAKAYDEELRDCLICPCGAYYDNYPDFERNSWRRISVKDEKPYDESRAEWLNEDGEFLPLR